MSARYPSYSRIDLSGTKNLTVLKKMVVLYFGVTNLLDKRNTIRYDYASDFSGRLDQQSIFGRTLFLGIYVVL
jgi:outer membrane receptor for ferrienterochelin and colicin